MVTNVTHAAVVDGGTEPARHVVPLRVYFLVFGALMALTALTVAAAMQDLGPLNIVVALAIACTKAVLVVL